MSLTLPSKARRSTSRLLFAADDGAGEEERESGIASEDVVDQVFELLQHFVRLLALVGGVEQRLRVDAGDVPGGVVEDGGVMDLLAVGHDGLFDPGVGVLVCDAR